jgi:hypothetical protein
MGVEYRAWETEQDEQLEGLASFKKLHAHSPHLTIPRAPHPRCQCPAYGVPQMEQSILLAEIYPTFKDQVIRMGLRPCGEAILSAPTPCTSRPN